MSIKISIHGISKIAVSAYSEGLYSGLSSQRMHCQILEFFDCHDSRLGEAVLFLDSPAAALRTGDCSQLDSTEPVLELEEEKYPF